MTAKPRQPLSMTPAAVRKRERDRERKRLQRAHHEDFDSEEWCAGFWYDGVVVPDMMVAFGMLDSEQRDDRHAVNVAIVKFLNSLTKAWAAENVPGDNS